MKKLRRLCLLLLLITMFVSMALPSLAQEQGDTQSLAITSGCSTLDGKVPLQGKDKLLDTAKAAILYDMDSKTLIYAWNPDQTLDPSGMNKIMTAMLAIEKGNPDAVVTVSRSALDSVGIGAVSAGLKAGEEITLKDLLYCMMVGSANDAAAVIAEHIGGSQQGFVDLMNQKAQELGCQNTQFLNASGLSKDGQHTTARDLAKITEAALENELFVELFSAVSYSVPATNESEVREIVTTNYLMSQETVRNQYDERVTGGKTGALSTTDRSLISTAVSDGKRYLSVVMSAKGSVTANGLSVKTFGSFEETRALLDYGFENYSIRQLLHESQVMEQFQVSGGENDVIACPASAVIVTLPVDASHLDVKYQCSESAEGLKAPIQEGDVIGSVEVWFRNLCVGQCDLVAMHDVNEPGVFNVQLEPKTQDTKTVDWKTVGLIGGIVLLALIAVAGIAFLITQGIRQAKVKRAHKIRRKDRQRSR